MCSGAALVTGHQWAHWSVVTRRPGHWSRPAPAHPITARNPQLTSYLLQEPPGHPGLRGVHPGHTTPLAMMAALCNKTASMSPPPLADAAVGKGFHPWKNKGSPEAAGSGSRQPSGAGSTPSGPPTTSAASASAASSFSSPPHGATTPSPSYGRQSDHHCGDKLEPMSGCSPCCAGDCVAAPCLTGPGAVNY